MSSWPLRIPRQIDRAAEALISPCAQAFAVNGNRSHTVAASNDAFASRQRCPAFHCAHADVDDAPVKPQR